ncbi:hypothetical protein CEXT_718751 [Caerostris extrusa]|uniref:Uncharacterized protein n=1 Tax=Caerostris extrusa TaxID=172846 RepID=A0AAV4P739_CAEEX|nr:hypothetical protein CEXT_718751 [Caerostris extrusa]
MSDSRRKIGPDVKLLRLGFCFLCIRSFMLLGGECRNQYVKHYIAKEISANISFANIVASNITPQNTSAQIPNQNTPSPNNNTEIYQLLFILKEFAQPFSSDGIQTMFTNLQAATT